MTNFNNLNARESVDPLGDWSVTTYISGTVKYGVIKCTSQMSEAVMTGESDFQAGSIVQESSTTQFIQANPLVEGRSSASATYTSTYIESLATIKDFLSKPVLVNSGTWTTGNPNNFQLYTAAVSTLLVSNPIWANKIQGFNLLKADCVVTVQINASPFQAGKLILNYLPCVNDFQQINPNWPNLHNKTLNQKVQTPHVQLDCRQTSAAIRIPYIAPSIFHDFGRQRYEWAYFWLNVMVPLVTGPSAPPSGNGVDYLVYVHFENVELIAPIAPQMGDKVVRRNLVNESAENQGPIATGLRKVGLAAGTLSEIPILSRFTRPVEWVANFASGIAAMFGWSKPRELTGVTIVSNQLTRYSGTCDGPDISFPGGISCLNRIETIDYSSYTNEDEMSFPFLLSIPWYDGAIQWLSTQPAGTLLYNVGVNPNSFVTTATDTVAGNIMNFQYNSMYSYLGNIFNYWRGGFVLTLKFVKTQMHSGRLMVTFTPTTGPTYTTPTITTSAFSLRAIIDIRVEDEISFVIPYLIYSDYLLCNTQTLEEAWSGVLSITVLNELKGPESVAQAIAIQAFWKGAEDLEFAVPGLYGSTVMPYEPQMNHHEIILHGETPSNPLPTTTIGGAPVKSDMFFHASRCIGERILSVKQLLLKNLVVRGLYRDVPFNNKNLIIDPQFISTCNLNATSGAITAPDFGTELFSYFANCYAFRRGGTRFMIQDTDDTYSNLRVNTAVVTNSNNITFPNGFAMLQPIQQLDSPLVTIDNTVPNNNATVDITNGTPYFPISSMNVLDSNKMSYNHIPYYNRFPVSLNTYYNGTVVPTEEPSCPDGLLAVYIPAGFGNPQFQRSVSDDFQFMFFLGPPPTAASFIPATMELTPATVESPITT